IRTPDPQIRSLVLYPAELRALVAHRAGEGSGAAKAAGTADIAIGFGRPRQGVRAAGARTGAIPGLCGAPPTSSTAASWRPWPRRAAPGHDALSSILTRWPARRGARQARPHGRGW